MKRTAPNETRQTIEWVRNIIKEFDPQLEGEGYDAAQILLSSLIVGPDVDKVSAFTSLDRAFVTQIAQRLVANRVWVEGGVHQNWTDPEDGGIELALDIAVAQGLVERVGEGFIEPKGNN